MICLPLPDSCWGQTNRGGHGRRGPRCRAAGPEGGPAELQSHRQMRQNLPGWSWSSEGNRKAASSLQRRASPAGSGRLRPLSRPGVTAERRRRPAGGSAEQPGGVAAPCALVLVPQPAPPDGAGGLQAGAVLARGWPAALVRSGCALAAGGAAGFPAAQPSARSPGASLPSAGPRAWEPRAQAPRPVTPGSSARGGVGGCLGREGRKWGVGASLPAASGRVCGSRCATSGGPAPPGKSLPPWALLPPRPRRLLNGLASGEATSSCRLATVRPAGRPVVTHVRAPHGSRVRFSALASPGSSLPPLQFLCLNTQSGFCGPGWSSTDGGMKTAKHLGGTSDSYVHGLLALARG